MLAQTVLGSMTVAGGLFLFLWYRTLAALPKRLQPRFLASQSFKWGVPSLSALLLCMGFAFLVAVDIWMLLLGMVASAAFAFLVIRFDRYSAGIRQIHQKYQDVRHANPGMEEIECLYHTARWRYPEWDHDRIVELVAGKNIEALVLLMIIRENQIHPISDWELYRSMKMKAARIAGKRP